MGRRPVATRPTGEILRTDICNGGKLVSIVRIGLAESKNFAEGYDAIFGKKKNTKAKKGKSSAKASTKKDKKKKKK